jgi:hypothetical protein
MEELLKKRDKVLISLSKHSRKPNQDKCLSGIQELDASGFTIRQGAVNAKHDYVTTLLSSLYLKMPLSLGALWEK